MVKKLSEKKEEEVLKKVDRLFLLSETLYERAKDVSEALAALKKSKSYDSELFERASRIVDSVNDVFLKLDDFTMRYKYVPEVEAESSMMEADIEKVLKIAESDKPSFSKIREVLA